MIHVSYGYWNEAPSCGTYAVDYAVVLILERDDVDLDAGDQSDNLDQHWTGCCISLELDFDIVDSSAADSDPFDSED